MIVDGPPRARASVILAHGAGAPMDSPFMEHFAQFLAKERFRVVRFEFPYMAARRETGSKKPPDREPVLRDTWKQIVAAQGKRKVVIGGKSMGGRIASLVADEIKPLGLVCLGYPFHPMGKPERLRVEHLTAIETPTLIVQGERDAMGSREEANAYPLSKRVQLAWLTDGDHSFKPRKSSGLSEEDNLREATEHVRRFLEECLGV